MMFFLQNSRLQKSIASLKKTLKSKEYFIKSAVNMVEVFFFISFIFYVNKVEKFRL